MTRLDRIIFGINYGILRSSMNSFKKSQFNNIKQTCLKRKDGQYGAWEDKLHEKLQSSFIAYTKNTV